MGETSKGNDEMEWLTLFIYILIIFFNIFFDKFIPYANYTDELICLLFMAIAIVYICKDKGKVAVNKEQKISIRPENSIRKCCRNVRKPCIL